MSGVEMKVRKVVTVLAAVVGAITITAAPARAAPGYCSAEAFGHHVPIVCGSKVVSADWNGDGARDEVFFVSRPNYYVYRVSAASNGPVRVSNGKAADMDTYEVRPSGQHRIYAVSARGIRYYSYELSDGRWSEWSQHKP